ncbi:uncharacterized protein LOC120337780 [Styela clava]
MTSEAEEGPIENYEEFFNEILDDYQSLVSVTRLPDFMFKEPDLPENEYKHGKTCGNILIKNESNNRPGSSGGMLFSEHWMIFPEIIEPAIIEAVNGGKGSKEIVGKFHFSLHNFTEVKVSFTFLNNEVAEAFRTNWSEGEIGLKISDKIKETGYEDELCIRYFNSDILEELK